MRTNIRQQALLLATFLSISPNLFASELNGADTGWIMTSTALVLFMTIPGLSLFMAAWFVVKMF